MAGCANCSGKAGPGTLALEAFLTRKFSAASLGTYNCRNVRGGSSLSLHACGRAVDIGGFNAPGPKGDAIANWCEANRNLIGVEELIYNRRIITSTGGWRAYGGQNPHTSHVHIGISQAKAWSTPLTIAQLQAGGGPAGAGQTPGGATAPAGAGGGGGISLPDLGSVVGLFKLLADPKFYLRVATVAFGLLILAGAVALVAKDTIPSPLKEAL